MSVATWVAGARPRTLGAAIVPVAVGTASVAPVASVPRTLGALAVALGLQVGVNYANDYFDGIGGVDTGARVGPKRLVAAGEASPRAVLTAAVIAFSVAASAGALLALVSDIRILWVGAASIIAALAYSGGPRPFGGLGLGEAFVFVFFGLVATCGTAYVHALRVPPGCWWLATSVGLLAVALLMVNNIRDIETDRAAGKRTLAVRLEDARSRTLFRATIIAGLLAPVGGVVLGDLHAGILIALSAAPMAFGALRAIGDAVGTELIRVLQATALLHLQYGLTLAVLLWILS